MSLHVRHAFKSTATSASRCAGPFCDFYATLLAKGMKPELARLTLARKDRGHFDTLEERSDPHPVGVVV